MDALHHLFVLWKTSIKTAWCFCCGLECRFSQQETGGNVIESACQWLSHLSKLSSFPFTPLPFQPSSSPARLIPHQHFVAWLWSPKLK